LKRSPSASGCLHGPARALPPRSDTILIEGGGPTAHPVYWVLSQVEYSTDIVFRQAKHLQPIYENLIHTAIHAVKPTDVATFLGKRIQVNTSTEVGNDLHTRIQGTRLKHKMGPSSIKMYDKAGIIIRIETTTNDPSWFKHYRTVAHRDGSSSLKLAPLKKSIYSLHDLRQLAVAANRRYLAFLSALDDPTCAVETLATVTEKAVDKGQSYSGFNFFSAADVRLFEAVLAGENTIAGLRNADLRSRMPDLTPARASRIIKRLRMHGIVKKVGRTYKYYLTDLGRRLLVMGLKLKELVVIPAVSHALAT
jgi:hypothetical protein